ncbi:uncharacterized protein J7T54_000178 [Emericellopsis cladophorae]|uniref:Uncharacterized protein n=1 Tax=Emericellopsis cladophorae TaxID=2686198 RepID=A0A9P9XZ24_9HYPO|nr:uncharacterized protein J7T54_000178 [Emericellopsis cladophorae]KAI6780538.1 hypothetical protein J7T54_000178 [Emericellopsis cladophorae]
MATRQVLIRPLLLPAFIYALGGMPVIWDQDIFFIEESPRWLLLVNRREEAMAGLSRLRGLPVDDPRVQHEIVENEEDIDRTAEEVSNASFWIIAKETFTKSPKLRRVQHSVLT